MATTTTDDCSTRDRILEQALELFARFGFAGTSIRALARASKLRESSIYNHFASKEDLYLTLIDQWGPGAFVEKLKSDEYRRLEHDPQEFFLLCAKDLLLRWTDRRETLFDQIINKDTIAGVCAKLNRFLFEDEVVLLGDFFTGFLLNGLIKTADARETARTFIGGLVFIRREHLGAVEDLPSEPALRAALSRFIENFIILVEAKPVMPSER